MSSSPLLSLPQLDKWLDLLDVGHCIICLVDGWSCVDPQLETREQEAGDTFSHLVWRRLLLGEGDDDDAAPRPRDRAHALERLLRSRGFKRVGVLAQGGLIRMIDILRATSLEPVVIGHDEGQWARFRGDSDSSSRQYELALRVAEARGHTTVARILRERLNGSAPLRGDAAFSSAGSVPSSPATTARHASGRGHKTVATLLRDDPCLSAADLEQLQVLT